MCGLKGSCTVSSRITGGNAMIRVFKPGGLVGNLGNVGVTNEMLAFTTMTTSTCRVCSSHCGTQAMASMTNK